MRIAGLLLALYALSYAMIRLTGLIERTTFVPPGGRLPTMMSTADGDVARFLFTAFGPCVRAELWALELL